MSIKRKEAKEILNTYAGENPYILDMKWKLENDRNFDLTIVRCNYIIRNKDYKTIRVNKVVELENSGGEMLANYFKLDFIPKKIMVHMIIGDTDKDYHIIGQLTTKDQPKMFFVRKTKFMEDIEWQPLSFNPVDFDRYDARLMERKGFKLMNHQKEGINFLLSNHGAILADQMGVAKGELLSNKLFTPYGRKRMGDIVVGDEVIGSNGKSTKVTGVFPLGKKPIYRVTFNDGYYLDVTDEHYWEVTTCNNGVNTKSANYKKYILDVKQLLDKDGFVEEKHANGRTYKIKTYYKCPNGNNKWQIPIVKPIEFNINEELPIDPYLLGLSLGDGHFVRNGNNVNITFLKEDYKEIIEPFGFKLKEETNTCYVGVLNLGESLTDMGLNGSRSHNKFIPEQYKYTTIENRLAILRGLMDTDGCCVSTEKDGFKGAEFTSVSERLVDDLIEIVHTLGGIVRKTKGQGKYVKNGVEVLCKEYYKLNIKFNEINPFNLSRKANKYKSPTKYKVGRYIKNIEYLGEEEAQCIRVDAEDHLYVSEHAIVTHNTLQAIVAALDTRFKRILVVCPAAVKINWEREINIFSDNTSIINGNVFTQARFTIINYDILKNFHTSKGMFEKNPNDPVITTLIDAKFDLIIIDEAHNLRNKDSIRGEIMAELCSVYGKPRVWLLSGTPVANRPKDFYNLLKLIKTPITNDYPYYVQRYCKGHKQTVKFRNGTSRETWVANGADNLDELRFRTKHLMLRRLKKDVLDLPEKTVSNVYVEMGKSAKERYDDAWENYLLERKKKHKGTNVDRKLVESLILRQLVANEAVPYTHEMGVDIIEGGNKLIIFTTFDEEQKRLKELFGDIAVCHNGKMNDKQKQVSIDRFQTDDSVKVFIGNIISAGAGITLTAATYTIFNSFSWVPGDNDQGEDRSHRMGQKNNCSVYYMLFKDTISEIVLNSLKSKNKVIDKILGNEDNKQIEDIILDKLIEHGAFL